MNMKRSFGVALGIVLLTLLIASSAALAETTSFKGLWESTDTGDNSYQWLNVSGGGPDKQLHVVYCDTGTSGYGVDPVTGEPLYAGLGVGVGEVDGNQLTCTLRFFRCLGPPQTVYTPVFDLEYHAASNTLTDPWGGVWNRR